MTATAANLFCSASHCRTGSKLDEVAQQRSTSVYLVDRVIPMLPRMLCEELCSLNPGTERLAMSIIWDMDQSGEIMYVCLVIEPAIYTPSTSCVLEIFVGIFGLDAL